MTEITRRTFVKSLAALLAAPAIKLYGFQSEASVPAAGPEHKIPGTTYRNNLLISVEGGDLYWTDDGTAPSKNHGMKIANGEMFWYVNSPNRFNYILTDGAVVRVMEYTWGGNPIRYWTSSPASA